MDSERSLSALLSQILVAFTVEFDNEFERRMGEAGYLGARLSSVVWTNLMQFVGEAGASVRDLAAGTQVKLQLGCLERWGFLAPQPDSAGDRRDGWGSGRGIRADWTVRLTSKGISASRIWPPLFGEIERRWESRFGKEQMSRLRRALTAVAKQPDLGL